LKPRKMYYHKKINAAKFEAWVTAPVRDLTGSIIEKRYYFIEDFVEELEKFLTPHDYTLGANKGKFKRALAHWWFYMELAAKSSKFVQYTKGPLHRNHIYDYAKFMDTFDTEIFEKFIEKYTISGFCDDSSESGKMTCQELKTFIYYNIDMANSPAREEIDERLREEEEIRRAMADAVKNPYKNNRWDYDVSELGSYRGDRVMS